MHYYTYIHSHVYRKTINITQTFYKNSDLQWNPQMGIFWEVKDFAVPSSTFKFCSYSYHVLRTSIFSYMQGYLQVFCSLLASHASLLGLWTLLLGRISTAPMHKVSLWWNHWISTFSSVLYLFYGSWTLGVDFAHRRFCAIFRQKLGLFLVFTVEKRAGRQENQQFCSTVPGSTPLLVSKLLRYHLKRWRNKPLH